MFGFGKNAADAAAEMAGTAGASKVLRVGVYYDGSFLHHVSNYYKYVHERKQRLSLPGLQEFIRAKAAQFEGVENNYAHVVDSHFFRGRFSAQLSQANDKLYLERLFDDVLISEGIAMHYMPVIGNRECGIDVSLALECYERATQGIYDVVALVAGDGDFVPLVTKLNRLGIRVMIVGWTFEYTDSQNGGTHQTTTSQRLIAEATYPVAMHEIMDSPANDNDPLVRRLFVEAAPLPQKIEERRAEGFLTGIVCSMKDGFGFIYCSEYPNNIFFHYTAVTDGKFDDLTEGDNVSFKVETGDRGELATNVRKI